MAIHYDENLYKTWTMSPPLNFRKNSIHSTNFKSLQLFSPRPHTLIFPASLQSSPFHTYSHYRKFQLQYDHQFTKPIPHINPRIYAQHATFSIHLLQIQS